MNENLNNSIYQTGTTTRDFIGLNFDDEIIQLACNDCYVDYLSGNKEITNGCFMCAEFTPKIEQTKKEMPFLDFLTVATIFIVAFCVFKLTLIDIWKD